MQKGLTFESDVQRCVVECILKNDLKSLKNQYSDFDYSQPVSWGWEHYYGYGKELKRVLHCIFFAQSPEMVHWLVEKGANVNSIDSQRFSWRTELSPLMQYLKYYTEEAKCYYSTYEDFCLLPPPDRYRLFSPDLKRHWEDKNAAMVEALIEAGADVNAITSDSDFPLLLAAKIGNPQLIKLLLQKGADVIVLDINNFIVRSPQRIGLPVYGKAA